MLIRPSAASTSAEDTVTAVTHALVHSHQPVEVQVYQPPVLHLAIAVPTGNAVAAMSIQQQQLADLCSEHYSAFAHSSTDLRAYTGQCELRPLRLHPTTAELGGKARMPPPHSAVNHERISELRSANII
jgi:hypothetical protein